MKICNTFVLKKVIAKKGITYDPYDEGMSCDNLLKFKTVTMVSKYANFQNF